MKKVLLVTRVSGFVPQFEMNNVKVLQEMGYEVHYAANFNTIVYGNDNSRLEQTGIVQHQVDFERSPFSNGVKRAYRQLRGLMVQEQFELIHCHMPMSGVLTRIAADSVRKETGKNVPVLYTAHGLHFYSGAPWRNWLYYPIERYLARKTDCLILINQEDYQRGQHFPVRGSVEYIPGVGMRAEEKSMASEKAGGIRQQLGLSENTKILVSAGELSHRKNQMVLVEMMSELKDLNLVCLICGSGAMEETLRQRIQELGLESKVLLMGYVDPVQEVLCQADCFVFPSLQEGLPVAVMEAMAAGLPVIASRIRGIVDLIEHTKGGYLVQGFDPVDYSVKVRRMFTEKEGKSAVPREERRQQMGMWNKERIRQFSIEEVECRMRNIYQQAEGKRAE